jgi:pimeloyl-ACP methyl ester carboxylesterase
MLAAMTPAPGESAGPWWSATGQREARLAFDREEGRSSDTDVRGMFFHDVPDGLWEAAQPHEKGQADKPFGEPWPLEAWPDVPTRFLLCSRDRVFPPAFQRRLARERLGLVADEFPTGHLPALVRPAELAGRLESYRAAL